MWLHVERFCISIPTLYVVLYLLSCSASNNLYYYLLSSPVAVPRVCVCVCVCVCGVCVFCVCVWKIERN